MRLTLKLAAPYLAVAVFWCIMSNGWLAILAYHAQVLFWSRQSLAELRTTGHRRIILLTLPVAIVGPAAYFLLPFMTHSDLSAWLINHHLSHVSLLAMIPYFGLVHPVIEQLHWAPLRKRTLFAHPLFAGYHIVVLYSLLTIPWLILCFVVLTGASFAWQYAEKRFGNLAIPVLSHMLADLGIVIAAWLRSIL